MESGINKSGFFVKIVTLVLTISLVPFSYNVAAQGVSANQLEEVVVTARRVEETLQSVPVSVTALTGIQLERSGVESIIDLATQIPNMRYRSNNEAGGAWIIMRGQNQVSGELNTDSPVGTYFDGVNMPRTRGMDQGMFDMERVEVLKGPQGTLYGRNSMAGAINIISKKPSHIDGVTGFAQATKGTYDLIELGGAVNVPVTDNFSTRFAMQRLKRDGFSKQLSKNPVTTDLSRDYQSLDNANQIFFRGSALWDPTENINVHFVADWKELDEAPRANAQTAAVSDPLHSLYQRIATQAGITGGTATERGLQGMAIYQSFQDGDIHTDYGTGVGYIAGLLPPRGSYYNDYGGGLTVSWALDSFNITSISGYRYQTITNVNDLDGMPFNLGQSSSSDEGDFYSEEIRLDGSILDDRLGWQVGAYYSFEDAHHYGIDDSPPTTTLNSPTIRENFFENTSWAGFAQIGYALTDTLNLTLGGRYTEEQKDLISKSRDYTQATWPNLTIGRCRVPPGTQPVTDCHADFSDTFDKWSYLVSLDYAVSPEVMVYASTATGWRGGGQNSRGNITTLTFASFGPDTATNYEAGLKGDWFDNRFRTNLAVYYTKLNDLQRRRNIQAGVLTAVVQTNAANATIQGFELDLTATPIDGLNLRAGIGLTDASYDDFMDLGADAVTIIDRSEEPFEGVSKWVYTLDGRYEWQMGPGIIGAGANWFWGSEQDHYLAISSPLIPPSAGIIEAYGLLNLRFDYRLEDLGLEFALWGRNVLDKKHLTKIQDSAAGNGWFSGFPGTRALWGLEVKKDF